MIPWLKREIAVQGQRGHMPLVKKLVRVGDSYAVILDPELLRQVGVEPDSDIEVTVEDKAIVIRSSPYANDDDVRAVSGRVIRNRRRLLERLAKQGNLDE